MAAYTLGFTDKQPEPGGFIAIEHGEQVTEEELRRWHLYSQMWHRAQETSYLQAREGLLDESIIQGLKSIILLQASSALFLDWERRKTNLDPGYVQMVDDARADSQRSAS